MVPVEDSLPFPLRLIIRGLSLIALAVALAWSASSRSHESLIVAITSASAVIVIFAAGKPTTYEVVFGPIRVVAFTLVAGFLSVTLALLSMRFVGVESLAETKLIAGIAGLTMGFICGLWMSLRIASVQLYDLVAKSVILASVISAIMPWQRFLPNFLMPERFDFTGFLRSFPMLLFLSALFITVWEDLKVLCTEARSAE